MNLVRLDHVAKRFHGARGGAPLEALRDIGFSVAGGEFVTLLGASGCGKSTLLRLVAGLLAPDEGTITWEGGRPSMGFVFQQPTLMPWADALTNVRLPLDLKGAPRDGAHVEAAACLARLGLAGFEQAYPRELSGGMQMRVSLARALAARPRLLLLDEPFAALDEITRAALNDDLKRMAREDAITVLFVTHSVGEAAYLSDRVLVMHPRPGRIAAAIRLDDGPRDRLSAAFAGDQARLAAALQEAA